ERLWSELRAARRQVRRDGVLAVIFLAAAVIPSILLVAWVLGGLSIWSAPSVWPLILVVLGIALAVGCAIRQGRAWIGGVTDTVIAAASELRHGLPEGRVRGLLELGEARPAGASAALYQSAEVELARELAGCSARDLAGAVGDRARRR